MKHKWNRCDVCGLWIAYKDFRNGAIRVMVLPESDLSKETYKTLCIEHAEDECKISDKG